MKITPQNPLRGPKIRHYNVTLAWLPAYTFKPLYNRTFSRQMIYNELSERQELIGLKRCFVCSIKFLDVKFRPENSQLRQALAKKLREEKNYSNSQSHIFHVNIFSSLI